MVDNGLMINWMWKSVGSLETKSGQFESNIFLPILIKLGECMLNIMKSFFTSGDFWKNIQSHCKALPNRVKAKSIQRGDIVI